MSELDAAVLRFKDAVKRHGNPESVKDAWVRMSLTSTQKRDALKRQKAGFRKQESGFLEPLFAL